MSLRQEVKLGVRQAGKVEMVAGVALGDTVVVAGQQRLQQDGSPVRVVDLNAGGRAGKACAICAPASAPGFTAGGQPLSREPLMQLAETSIRRPVFATVLSLLIVLIGAVSFNTPDGARIPQDRRAGGVRHHHLCRRLQRGHGNPGDQGAGRLALGH